MNRMRPVYFAVILLCSVGVAKAKDDADKLGLQALHALGYGELLRVTVHRDCRSHMELRDSPICRKIDSISDNDIERLAVPYFNKHVSPGSAKDLMDFWGSPIGKTIKGKLIVAIGSNTAPDLTPEENKLLDEINRSDAGKESAASANDKESSLAVLRLLNLRLSDISP